MSYVKYLVHTYTPTWYITSGSGYIPLTTLTVRVRVSVYYEGFGMGFGEVVVRPVSHTSFSFRYKVLLVRVCSGLSP